MEIDLLSGVDPVYNPALMREYLPVASNDEELKRAGILIGAKLDMYGIAKNLRWGYLPENTLKLYGLDESQAKKLRSQLKEAEELYEKTGGNRLQFARAILEGLGNQDGKVKIDYKTLGSVAVSFEEQILQADPKTLLAALKSQVEGLGTLDNSAESVGKASDTLLKIGNIAQNIANITTGLAQKVTTTATPATADIHDEPQKKAGIGAWIADNKVMAGAGLLMLAGLAVTQFKMPEGEKNRIAEREYDRRAKKHGLSGVKRKRSKPKSRRIKRSTDLGIIPLM